MHSAPRSGPGSAEGGGSKGESIKPFKLLIRKTGIPYRSKRSRGTSERGGQWDSEAESKDVVLAEWLRVRSGFHDTVAKRSGGEEIKKEAEDEEAGAAMPTEKLTANSNPLNQMLLRARAKLQNSEVPKEGSLLLWDTDGSGRKRDGMASFTWAGSSTCLLHAADDLKDTVGKSFSLNIFPGGFSVDGQKEAHPFLHSAKPFLDSLDLGLVPPESSFRLPGEIDYKYYDGHLMAEIMDHRMPRQHDLKPWTHRLVLAPNGVSITSDLRYAWSCHQSLSLDDILLLERQMLLASNPSLCLDQRPAVGILSSELFRRTNRMLSRHLHPPRPKVSDFRRRFDPDALRRMQAAVRMFKYDRNASVKLERLAKVRAIRDSRVSIFEREQQDVTDDAPDFNVRMGAILSIFGKTPPRPTPPMVNPSQNNPEPHKGQGHSSGHQISPAHYIPPKLLRPGMPAERQMRFRKDSLCASISIQAKVPCCFNVWTRLDELSPENKIKEGTQTHLPAFTIGNSEAACKFGVQQFAIMLRDGWQVLFDSHAVQSKKMLRMATMGPANHNNPNAVLAAAARATNQNQGGAAERGSKVASQAQGQVLVQPSRQGVQSVPPGARDAAPRQPGQQMSGGGAPPHGGPTMQGGQGAVQSRYPPQGHPMSHVQGTPMTTSPGGQAGVVKRAAGGPMPHGHHQPGMPGHAVAPQRVQQRPGPAGAMPYSGMPYYQGQRGPAPQVGMPQHAVAGTGSYAGMALAAPPRQPPMAPGQHQMAHHPGQPSGAAPSDGSPRGMPPGMAPGPPGARPVPGQGARVMHQPPMDPSQPQQQPPGGNRMG